MLRHLPNALTASRGLAGLGVLVLLVGFGAHRLAFALYIAAILTDLVDGWLARRLGATSSTGAWLDPASDKLLAGSTWVALLWVGWAPLWLAAPLLARDGVVALVWAWSRQRGRVWTPNLLGRLMVSFEGVALPVLLLHHPWMGVHWASVGVILGTMTLALALASAARYVVDGPVDALATAPCAGDGVRP